MIRRTLLLLASAALLGACDGPTTPGAALSVQAVSGSAQQGLPGTPLQEVLTVRVLRADGTPAMGVPVQFEPAQGAGVMEEGQMVTNESGLAWAVWRLPNVPGPALSVTARVAGVPQTVSFTAGWLPREQADLLLIGGGASVVRGVFHTPGTVTGARSFTLADSLLLLPFKPADNRTALLAFTEGRPPLLRENLAWTAGRDTLRLDFPQPIPVPLTIWVVRAPYAAVRAAMEAQLQTAYNIWAGAGLLLNDVRWVDATGYANAGKFQGATAACGSVPSEIGKDEGRTNAYVTGYPLFTGVAGGNASGYVCAPDFITISYEGLVAPTLFAHEVGHTFGLPHHSGNNVMHPIARYSDITAGQVFWAHAHSGSSLQVLFADRAVIPGRNCAGFTTPASCLPTTYDF